MVRLLLLLFLASPLVISGQQVFYEEDTIYLRPLYEWNTDDDVINQLFDSIESDITEYLNSSSTGADLIDCPDWILTLRINQIGDTTWIEVTNMHLNSIIFGEQNALGYFESEYLNRRCIISLSPMESKLFYFRREHQERIVISDCQQWPGLGTSFNFLFFESRYFIVKKQVTRLEFKLEEFQSLPSIH